MVLASSLAAQGSVAAVADGAALPISAATAAPPAADTANAAYRLRRSALAVENMENSLRFANSSDTSANTSRSDDRVPDPKTVPAHIAINAAAAANPAKECAGEQQEMRRPA